MQIFVIFLIQIMDICYKTTSVTLLLHLPRLELEYREWIQDYFFIYLSINLSIFFLFCGLGGGGGGKLDLSAHVLWL